MIFNFCIYRRDGSADFGICSAGSLEEAEQFVREECSLTVDEKLNVEHGIEDLVNEQYGGVAFLTTERC